MPIRHRVFDLEKTRKIRMRKSIKRKLSVFDKHQLRVARDTLSMPDAMIGVMGGPTRQEAIEIFSRLTGKQHDLIGKGK